jgi:hypothetical protein
MIDPLLSLAFAIHSNPGVYACLLGSGISRAAEIPTGWEIVLDLLRKLAYLEDENCEPDPAAWYKDRFGEEPDYSKLLDQLAHSQADRNRLLSIYFEPDEDERDRGAKLPTDAHKAIAQLVADGSIRVIITTNFDRLLEQALEEVGIAPIVIATPDAAEGAVPLAHSHCTIIKVHGDYLDTRIKNTPAELAQYDARIDRLLDQVLDEYGLIICGWSGVWDTALIAALERCTSHRFTTYWTAYQGNVDKYAEILIALRKAQVIAIEDADDFFCQVSEKVTALKEYDKPHPLSAKLAVASLKRYIAEDRYRISLHDLVVDETKLVCDAISDENFPSNVSFSDEELINRIRRYESAVEVLQALMAYGCFWGREQHQYLWIQTMQRVANANMRSSGRAVWLDLKLYPALLLLYSGGIAAIAAGRYDTLRAILFETSIRDLTGEYSLLTRLNTWRVMSKDVQKRGLSGKEEYDTPLSEYLLEILREPLKDILPDDSDYETYFDMFEYLFYLLYVDATYDEIQEGARLVGPFGRFYWRYFRRGGVREGALAAKLDEEIAKSGEEWGLIKAGSFGGSLERYNTVKEAADRFISSTAANVW